MRARQVLKAKDQFLVPPVPPRSATIFSFGFAEIFQHWQGPRAAGMRGCAGNLHRGRPKCRPKCRLGYRGRQPRGHPPPGMVNHRSILPPCPPRPGSSCVRSRGCDLRHGQVAPRRPRRRLPGAPPAEDAGRGCSARELERQQCWGNQRPKAGKRKPRAALGATGVVSGRVPRVSRTSQELYDVFCRRPRAVPLGTLLPPPGERESKHLTCNVRAKGGEGGGGRCCLLCYF